MIRADSELPHMILERGTEENPENDNKRVQFVSGLQDWLPWHIVGCPPFPDPHDTRISKRRWEWLCGEVRRTVHQRMRRSAQLSSLAVECGVWDDTLWQPDPYDDNIAEEEWLDLVDMYRNLLRAASYLQFNMMHAEEDADEEIMISENVM
jgi:hypothetical protein